VPRCKANLLDLGSIYLLETPRTDTEAVKEDPEEHGVNDQHAKEDVSEKTADYDTIPSQRHAQVGILRAKI
jgi:hypothetical protein